VHKILISLLINSELSREGTHRQAKSGKTLGLYIQHLRRLYKLCCVQNSQPLSTASTFLKKKAGDCWIL